ncbi:MAG: glycosyltransferase [Pseudomonadota bacterium]
MANKKLKICFVLDHPLHHYRVFFFKKLLEAGIDLTIFHPGVAGEYSFKDFSVPMKRKWGFICVPYIPFDRFDVVVHMQNLRMMSLWKALISSDTVFTWGIGTSSAKGLGSESKLIRMLRNAVILFTKRTFFYSNFPVSLVPNSLRHKVRVAINTVHVDSNLYCPNNATFKNNILCIGTLNERKGLKYVFESFAELAEKNPDIRYEFGVDVVGDGPEYERLVDLAKKLGIDQCVTFFGRITDEVEKAGIYSRALVSCSPCQAGLSVLESFGHGVPFLTLRSAISGGEHFNIKSGETGWLVDDIDGLTRHLEYILSHKDELLRMGDASYRWYQEFGTVDKMVAPFLEEFENVKSKKKTKI